MITLGTHPREIYRTLEEEGEKATWWMRKQMGGDRAARHRMEELQERIADICDERRFSEAYYYRSAAGNQWIAYLYAFKEDGYVSCVQQAYPYRLTEGSIECYAPHNFRTDDDRRLRGYIHYTTHFFRRLTERLRLDASDIAGVMQRFIRLTYTFDCYIAEYDPRRGYRDTEIAMSYPGSYALGTFRDYGDIRAVTVRTFVTASMLAPSRLARLRKMFAGKENKL